MLEVGSRAGGSGETSVSPVGGREAAIVEIRKVKCKATKVDLVVMLTVMAWVVDWMTQVMESTNNDTYCQHEQKRFVTHILDTNWSPLFGNERQTPFSFTGIWRRTGLRDNEFNPSTGADSPLCFHVIVATFQPSNPICYRQCFQFTWKPTCQSQKKTRREKEPAGDSAASFRQGEKGKAGETKAKQKTSSSFSSVTSSSSQSRLISSLVARGNIALVLIWPLDHFRPFFQSSSHQLHFGKFSPSSKRDTNHFSKS